MMTNGLLKENLTDRYSYCPRPFRAHLLIAVSFALVLLLFPSCNQTEVKEPVEYKGPLREVDNVETFYSENNLIKVKIVAEQLYEFANGDREFPKGIYVEFFDETGQLESTLRANHAFYFKEENLWRGRGKVQVKNIAKNEQLNTEELFWKSTEERIYTDKFVTIRQQGDVLYGEGLQAKQDMSDYTIIDPKGDFEVKED
jgi:LPS export ABC transporter protein LptC